MAGAAGALLKAGLAVKVGHLKRAINGYTHDTVSQARSIVVGYAVGAGLYLAAGLFLIAAIFVGAAALFRWIEANYGANVAFGVIGGGLVVLSLLCVLAALGAMRTPKANYPSLGSRLRVALRANPTKAAPRPAPAAPTTLAAGDRRDHVDSARNTASAILRAPPTPRHHNAGPQTSPLGQRAGIAAAVGLLGWALARRYSRPGRSSLPRPPRP